MLNKIHQHLNTKWLPLWVLLLASLVAIAILFNKPSVKKRHHRKKIQIAEVVSTVQTQYAVEINGYGTIDPKTITTVVPRVSGSVVKVAPFFKPGGFFNKGDVLLELDTLDYEVALEGMKSEFAQAKLNYEQEKARSKQAKLNWSKLSKGRKANDLVLNIPQLELAKAQFSSAQAKLRKARQDLSRTKIIAPYSGRVLDQFVDIGQYVTPGTQLLRIFSTDYVELRVPITEEQYALVGLPEHYRDEVPTKPVNQPKAFIESNVAGEKFVWTGTVVRTEGTVDVSTRQIFLVIKIDNPYDTNGDNRPPLKIGQFVSAKVKGVTLENVIVVPRSIVRENNYVMVVDRQSKVKRTQIKLLWENDQEAVLSAKALAQGDRILSTYLPFVANGSRVKIKGEALAKEHGKPGHSKNYSSVVKKIDKKGHS